MDVLPTPDEDLGWRLANLEGRLDALSERLGRLESAVRGAVADEVQGATAELRRAISELGRRLVQDLPAELARHRDAIVAQVLAQLPPPAPPQADEPAPAGPMHEELEQGPAASADEAAVVGEAPEAAERRRVHRLRRRQG